MSRPDSLTVRAAVRIYGAAVRLLPRAFRVQYGSELVSCFEAIAQEERARHGRLAALGATARAVGDLLTRAPRQHLTSLRERRLVSESPWRGAWQDVRHAARRLRRRPAFAATATLTLGLGIGAVTAVFSVIHGVVLSPLPYPEPDRIVEVDHAGPGAGSSGGLGITYGFYRFYAAHVPGAEAWAMYSSIEQTLVGAGEPVRLVGIRATPSLADVLSVGPRLGQWFTAADGRPGAPLRVVLSDRLWRERFGGSADVIGRQIDLGGVTREVIGVMPRWFAFPSAEVEFWVPRVVPPGGVGGWNESAVARLATGVEPAALEREIVGRYPMLRETTDDPRTVGLYLDDARVTPIVAPLKESVIGDMRATLWLLLAAVGAVLLIALANVANLFLIRAEENQRELAVRSALGAGRARLVRSFAAEGLVLAGAAGAIGITAAAAGVRLLRVSSPVNLPRLDEVGISLPVLGVGVGLTLAAGVVVGLLPLFGRRGASGAVLSERTRSTTAGRASRRSHDVLMAAQIALALVLLIGSGLLLRTYGELRSVELGFTERQALTFDLALPGSRYPARADAARFHNALLERLRALPGVASAGAVGRCLPLRGNMCWGETLEAEGYPRRAGEVPPVTGMRIATTDYFRSLGIRVRGRTFSAADERGDATAVIVSEATARAYFGDDDPIGKRVRLGTGSPWHTVVGVAANVRGRVDTDELNRVLYLPMLPEGGDGPPAGRLVYVLRTEGSPAALTPAVRQVVAELDPALPLADVQSLQDLIDRATAPTAFALALAGLAGGFALALGTVGVYAVLAYAVSRRTSEIGLRVAIGASPADVRGLILRQGGGVVLAGAGVGLGAALLLGRFAEGMLFGVSATDPATFGTFTAVMLSVAGFALWLPARSASRIDPVKALRVE